MRCRLADAGSRSTLINWSGALPAATCVPATEGDRGAAPAARNVLADVVVAVSSRG